MNTKQLIRDWHDGFVSGQYKKRFSYEGLKALFESETDENHELDVIGIIIDWTEYETIEDIKTDFTGIESIDDLQANFQVDVIEFSGGYLVS